MSAARFALAVVLAWLMPWRAAATIRSQQESITCLIRTVARLAAQERAARPPQPARLRLVK